MEHVAFADFFLNNYFRHQQLFRLTASSRKQDCDWRIVLEDIILPLAMGESRLRC
jgi:hypothetical protein